MIDELLPGNRVAHTATDRRGLVLKLRFRWYGVPSALVEFDEPAGTLRNETRWIPRACLKRVDPA